VFWEHEVFGGAGQYVRNLLGLAAVVVERTGTRLGADIPGDEAAGTTAIPFRQDPETEFFFDFEGPLAPLCPGLVDDRPEPGSCPQTAVVACQDCPLPIQDLQTTSSLITINTTAIPTQCVVEDVDVLIDITHTFDGDLVVDLSSPDTADVQLFNSICGASNNIQAILDDEAAQPIGTVCPPLGMQPWDTAPPGQLTQFEGGGTNGTWKLDVFDQFGADQGTLNTWELQFTLSAQ
ncbi:MAG: proprotein convertase P-domain-containing protein, partial [Anaerolineae bacterium]